MAQYRVVGASIDSWLINVEGKLPDGLAEELDFLKEASQEVHEGIPTCWTFAGGTHFILAHGSGRQWRWILHCPSLHLDIGGRLNHIIGKAQVSPAFLWSTRSAMRCMCSARGHGRPPHQSIRVYISICLTPGNCAISGGWSDT